MSLYLGNQKIQNMSVGTRALGINDTGINSETTTEFNGILKGENGKITTAVSGTDYLAPDALNNLGDLANKDKVGLADLDTDVNQKLDSGLTINDINTAIENGTINISSTTDPPLDKMLVNKKYVDKKTLPKVSTENNGSVLGVKNGAWAITEPPAKVYAGSYIGDGTTSRNITLEFAPKVMFILIEVTEAMTSISTLKQFILMNGRTESLISIPGSSSSNEISLFNNDFQITGTTKHINGNETGKIYNYVLLA